MTAVDTRQSSADPAQRAGGAALPPRAGAGGRARGLRARFRGVGQQERWGYGVWLFVGLIFGVPESWAGITSPPWPALSNTVGHLEQLWPPLRVIVVTVMVFAVFHALRYLPGRTGQAAAREDTPNRGRVPRGWVTRSGASAARAVPVLVYFPLAVGVVAGGSVIAAVAGGGRFVLGYVIYGLIAVFLMIIPNALAYWFATEAPFPTLDRTVVNLERRWRPCAMVIVAGLVVLTVHLVFFPWPDIVFRP